MVEQSGSFIEEYERTENPELLKLAMDIQVQQILPEARNLRMLKYDITEINQHEISTTKTEHVLFQYPIKLSKLDYQLDDVQPHVIHFDR